MLHSSRPLKACVRRILLPAGAEGLWLFIRYLLRAVLHSAMLLAILEMCMHCTVAGQGSYFASCFASDPGR